MAIKRHVAQAVLQINGPIASVVLSNPPANMLTDAMRAEIYAHIETADADPSVTAIVLAAQGHRFSRGMSDADLDRPQAFPDLNTLCNRIEMCTKPVVAALAGAVVAEGWHSHWPRITVLWARMRDLPFRMPVSRSSLRGA